MRRAHRTLERRLENGSWATAAAKKYPDGLCRLLDRRPRFVQLSGDKGDLDLNPALAPSV